MFVPFTNNNWPVYNLVALKGAKTDNEVRVLTGLLTLKQSNENI